MIHISKSYGFDDDSRYNNLKNLHKNIQLALFHYETYKNKKNEIFEFINNNKINVRVTHLPIDSLRVDFVLIYDMINEIYKNTKCETYVIHPNKLIEPFMCSFTAEVQNPLINLSLETFQWRKKKVFRSPLEIIEACNTYGYGRINMTIDTSHLEENWFNYMIMNYLLKYTKVIHLSNRRDRSQHMPFNIPNGDLDLVTFIKDIKRRYKWSGDIVLEYMPEYNYKLETNIKYIEKLLS